MPETEYLEQNNKSLLAFIFYNYLCYNNSGDDNMKLLLCGGGSGHKTIEANKIFDTIINPSKPLLYIPLAMNEKDHPYDSCFEWIKQEMSNTRISTIEMVRTFEELAEKDYSKYCAIFIGGGNTYKLLDGLKKSGAFEKIKRYLTEEEGIVYGGSAGAIIFGKDLDSCNTDDDNEVGLIDNTGFNMINGYSLLCHYTNRNEEKIEISKEYLLELSKKKPVYAIPEEDTIYIDDKSIEFIGIRPYYEFKDGEMHIYNPIELVPYTDNDYEFIYNVKKQAYKKYAEECWGAWIEEDQKNHFDKFINHVKENTYIIMYNGKKIGFYNGEVLENGNYEVGNICIIPEYQGQGIGSKILKDKLEENIDKDIEIQCFKSNKVSELYKRLGFIPSGETKFHYQMIKPKKENKKL